jgi:murein DD-endopeptidase MepM/ murein hydrolase activator NlpD
MNWLPHISSYYGYRIHPISGAKDLHLGVDIALPSGTEILAAQSGTVTFAGNNGGYGLIVVIDNGEGLVSKYAHCSALLVSAGQTVEAGQAIARVGSTGTSTGAHLHFETLKDGQYLNPLFFAVTNDWNAGPTYGDPGIAMGDGTFAALITEANKHLGKPYVFGANGPNAFDCSSFVCWVYTYSGVYNMPRTTAQGIYNQTTPIPSSEAKPGDIIFFTGTYSPPNAVSHVGIYVGNNTMIHAGNPIHYARIDTPYWQNHFYSFGRLPN